MGGRGRCTGYTNYFRDYKRLGPIAKLATSYVKDRTRLWKAGVRDLVMELCCALHNFRVRLTPWQPMV